MPLYKSGANFALASRRFTGLLLLLALVGTACASNDPPYLVLVSFDGFRHDYQDRFATPNFDRLAARGLRSDGLVPGYPSKTFPGHFTIVTGLYPENHGLPSNTVYDEDRNQTYRINDPSMVSDASWYRGEPLWVTAERQGMRSGTFFWVGSEADIGGVAPSYRRDFDAGVANRARVDGVIEWLSLPEAERPHFITLYFSMTDAAGHSLDPDSEQMEPAVLEADTILGHLLDGLEGLPHGDQVYLVVVSDHGMSAVKQRDYVDLSRFPGVRMVDRGAHVSFSVPGDGPVTPRALRDDLREQLPESDVFLRQDMPERLHHRSDERIGDVEVVVAPHHVVLRLPDDGVIPDAGPPRGGAHGYDPYVVQDMHGILLAAGPGIDGGSVVAPVEMVHLYPWMASLLGLEPAPSIDGDLEVMRKLSGVPAIR